MDYNVLLTEIENPDDKTIAKARFFYESEFENYRTPPTDDEITAARELFMAERRFLDGGDLDESYSAAYDKLQRAKRSAKRRVRMTYVRKGRRTQYIR